MEATERLVRTWMATGRDEEVKQTVAEISSGEISLSSVVKALGEYLTSDEDVLRTKGVDFLSQIISQCPADKINRQASKVLVSFFTGKLEDRETVVPALKGILTLTTLPTFTSSNAVETIQALFKHADMKYLLQASRYNVFQIIDSLLARHRQALQDMKDEFLTGYISLADGEKDPRNLMLVFSMDRIICIEFDISKHVDELFNIIYCYFPITFKTPADDPYGITADDLRLALRQCLSASSSFGRLGVPLFLEKLLAGSPSTKRDILETIGICIPIYGSEAAKHFATKLWNSLKLEIFQPVHAEAEAESLKTTQILIKTIYDDSVPSGPDTDDLQGLVKEICDECLELMNEPEKSQAVPASKVAAALIGTTPKITRLVLSTVIPHILKLFRNPDEISHRPQILTLLCVVITAVEAKLPSFLGDEELLHLLLSYKDEVLVTFIAGVNVKDDREAALEGVKKLVKMDTVLTEEELVYVVHSINGILPSDNEGLEEASGDALDVLIEVAEKNSKIVEESTLPLLFSSLPDHPPARSAHDERARHWRTLRWLAKLCTSGALFETLVVRLSTKLDLICVPKSGSQDINDLEIRAAYMHSILKTLVDVLEVKVASKHNDVPKYIDRLIPRLFNLFFYLALSDRSISDSIIDPRLVKVTGQIITLVVQTLAKERQEKFAKNLQDAYFSGDLSRLAVGQQTLPTSVVFKPFANDAPSPQKNLVALLEAAIIGFHKDVLLPDNDLPSLLSDVQLWALNHGENELERDAAFHIVSSLVNKNAEKVTPFLNDQENRFWMEEISNNGQSFERRRIAIETWLWILKGLVMRNYEIQRFVGLLFELLDDEHVGWDAARTIGRIASGGDDVLTKRNHAVIRILYAQKYFSFVFPRILEEVKGSSLQRQSAGLVALTSLITSLPQTIYVKEMQTLMPLLIRGLDLPDVTIRTSILDTLRAVANDGGKEATEEHASTLVSSALKNALSREKHSVPLRIAALKYLSVIPSVVRYDILHPQKATLVRELEKALDDPKRVVRKEAVDARTTWFLYNG